jgi:Tol biopolymer transport system component
LAGLTSDHYVVPCIAPSGAKVAFSARCSLDKHDALYLLRPDGSGLEQVYYGDSPVWYPAWSPDGSCICFNAGSSVYEYNVNTGRTQRIISDALKWSATPAYSPDSRRILYRAASGLMVRTRGSDLSANLTRKAADRQPAPNPNGREIALVSDDDHGAAKLYLVQADGTRRKEITPHQGSFSHPSWSPDGELLLYDRTLDRHCNLYVVDRRTGVETRLTNEDSAAARFGCFAPDGRTIVFVQQDNTGQSLYAADFETGPAQARETLTAPVPDTTKPRPADTTLSTKPDTTVRPDTLARNSTEETDRSRYKIVVFSDDDAQAGEFLDSLCKMGYNNPDNYVAGNPTSKAVIKSNQAPDEVVHEITDLVQSSLNVTLEPVEDAQVPETTIYINLP